MKHWKPNELAALKKMRQRFLEGTAGDADYWARETDLALYDSTFGERIGWKWDAVLRELAMRRWQPKSSAVLDWGCGSGVAGRRVIARWPHFTSLAVYDRSPLAVKFAMDRAREEFPRLHVSKVMSQPLSGTLLVLSHVINELSSGEYARVIETLAKSNEIIWVEAGTHADSRRLIEVRETLRADFAPVAPCTHRAGCGLLAPENAAHWCHHLATPPPVAFQDARWAGWGREMNIDLRRLPYSFLVLERAGIAAPAGFSRVIGEPREAKGYLKVLSCQESGVVDIMLQKRDATPLFRELRKNLEAPIYRWTLSGAESHGGKRAVTAESGVKTPGGQGAVASVGNSKIISGERLASLREDPS